MSRPRNFALAALAAAAVIALLPSPAAAQTGPYSFYAVTPCRAVDTRTGNGGVIYNNTVRSFNMQGVCGVPAGAKAVAVNVTVTQPTTDGYITMWPTGGTRPVVSTINFVTGEQALANGAIVPLAASTPDISAWYGIGVPGTTWTTHLVLDITGYFQ